MDIDLKTVEHWKKEGFKAVVITGTRAQVPDELFDKLLSIAQEYCKNEQRQWESALSSSDQEFQARARQQLAVWTANTETVRGLLDEGR